MLKNKFKYISDVETAIKSNPGTAEMNYIDAFYWGYLACLYNTASVSSLLASVVSAIQCESAQIITETDKYNFYFQLLQNPAVTIDEYIEKKLENPRVLPNLDRVDLKEEEKLSEELIEQLKIEEEIEKSRIQKMKEEQQNGNVTCSICLEKLTEKDFLVLEGCEHLFHVECVALYSKDAIKSRRFPLRCPSENCKNELFESDLAEFLDENSLREYNEYTLQKYLDQNAGSYTWCPTPNCKYVFEADPNVPEFSCQVCGKHYCLACRVEYHKGMTCKEYQITHKFDKNDKLFMDLIKGRRYKQCEKCKFWVEKTQGCDNMICRCGHTFCYKCGFGPCQCGRIKRPPHYLPYRPHLFRLNRREPPVIYKVPEKKVIASDYLWAPKR